jgi:hypothetical protein
MSTPICPDCGHDPRDPVACMKCWRCIGAGNRVRWMTAALRDADVQSMSPQQVAEFCAASAPGATMEEIVEALKLVADELAGICAGCAATLRRLAGL